MSASPYTFEGARAALLGTSSAALKAVDALLGISLVAAGPIGVATGHPWVLAAWGWIDQKNELVARLDDLVNGGRTGLAKATGVRRQRLLSATHTALVAASFFAVLREELGPVFEELALTEQEQRRLVVGTDGATLYAEAVSHLVTDEVGLPWAGRGLDRNIEEQVRPYLARLAQRTFAFFEGLAAWTDRFGFVDRRRSWQGVTARAVDRYRAEYLKLAAEIPELALLTLVEEHQATHDSLARLEKLVASLARADATVASSAIDGLNTAVLDTPMTDLSEIGDLTAVRSPTVGRGYLEPAFRWAVVDRGSQPADEAWWRGRPLETDLSGFLAAHLASPLSAEQPLVVLGHPGSGKSLFTKVTAARLSASEAFTTIRVSLRDVRDPSASVYEQIAGVLADTAHGKVTWQALAEASQDRTRVLLIDGLDELMQATGATESRYLADVMEFQRAEAAMGGPVAAVVTSRTVVADVATIPAGCLVVKLEDFDTARVTTWVERWNEANRAAVGRGEIFPINALTLLRYGDLARQPLLLTLLAIIASERDIPPDGTSASLYKLLLDDFVRRELARPDAEAGQLSPHDRRTTEIWKLGLVAFGMLNRSQTNLHEKDLADDLRALPGRSAPAVSNGAQAATRLVGRFFFIHTAEADARAGGRSYEFLHTTFRDYLVAHHTVEQLGAVRAADDDLLFALLSHRLIAAAGALTFSFARDLASDAGAVAAVSESLVRGALSRWDKGRFADYDPSKRPNVQRVAVYTANLVIIRLAVAGETPVPVARFCPSGSDVTEWWPMLVGLWRAALPSSDLSALLDVLGIHEDLERARRLRPPARS
ncbi:hypothetical protein DFJ67_7370 [Asanoa ferruginea]|uniref:NACHT N-terminal Helical domain-containing protein n=1 Tax=Asanoa ferruginea TaxID=53367 RepID=A0A3D9ZWA0_9ACTN|nr:hypothetical protein [Asanoa ferruginea]REG01290.1 hypothetical protein DFJ67_7370 [Asanoa ferruginea]GIF51477.1 hypothetical protein Afe04nite_60160 [Asanoa ferruginea]